MTFLVMMMKIQDKGVKLTDDIIKSTMRQLDSTFTVSQDTKTAIDELVTLPEAKAIKEAKKQAQKTAVEIALQALTAKKLIERMTAKAYATNFWWSAFNTSKDTNIDLPFFLQVQLDILAREIQTPFSKIAYADITTAKLYLPRLQRELEEAIKKGESQPQIIARIRRATEYARNRARLIAQTERNRVQSQARYECMKQAQGLGVKLEKQWLARLIRTRERHLDSHLTVVPLDKPFNNGLMFPGDPNGTADNVCNCFCVLAQRVVSQSPEVARKYAEFDSMKYKQFEKYLADKVKK